MAAYYGDNKKFIRAGHKSSFTSLLGSDDAMVVLSGGFSSS